MLLKTGAENGDLDCMFYYGNLLIDNGETDKGIVWKEKVANADYEPSNFENGTDVKQPWAGKDAMTFRHAFKI